MRYRLLLLNIRTKLLKVRVISRNDLSRDVPTLHIKHFLSSSGENSFSNAEGLWEMAEEKVDLLAVPRIVPV